MVNDKFVNLIDIKTFQPIDSYMVLRTPYRKVGKLIVSDDARQNGTETYSLVVSVGKNVLDPNYYQDRIEPGMLVYVDTDGSGIVKRIYKEEIFEKQLKMSTISSLVPAGQEHMADVLVGYYDYILVRRDEITAFVKQ